ncbi:large conductance mechanosensitive channel protein MscL [Paenibacillus sp. 1001270B_150601_E10]|uniref:large conductance mechanosensitive channel protein MscL n=1 Tax=Paenibacillus sp. 1001270B_150601_E10 TaxID=2787079 RepID=UPI0018A03E7C|nr:large conductance mechanosensitive channel protein MscL [Paenibacillus sp. 1001270B_150601_E10]
MGESKVKSFVQEFKDFAMRGNVIDLAVGVIIGGAFNKIVTSIVNDVIMPPIGALIGGMDFKDLVIRLDGSTEPISLADATANGVPVLAYGSFINTVIDFILVAFCVFILVKVINTVHRKKNVEEVKEEPTTKTCPYCITEIALEATRCPNCTSQLEEAQASR